VLIWGASSTGDLLWQRDYAFGTGGCAAYAITETDSNKFLVAGGVGNGVDGDFFLLMMEQDGCNINAPRIRDTTACKGPVQIKAGSGYDTYQWSNGGSGDSVSINLSGTYIVTVGMDNGCSASDTVNVTINICSVFDRCKNQGYTEDELFTPNAITPNGDGLNDQFKIPAVLEGSQLKIFNRWGSQVYLSTSYHNTWDGNNLDAGVYYYWISNPCLSTDFKGFLTVLK
jgi:gliding motility-associated-like protein